MKRAGAEVRQQGGGSGSGGVGVGGLVREWVWGGERIRWVGGRVGGVVGGVPTVGGVGEDEERESRGGGGGVKSGSGWGESSSRGGRPGRVWGWGWGNPAVAGARGGRMRRTWCGGCVSGQSEEQNGGCMQGER